MQKPFEKFTEEVVSAVGLIPVDLAQQPMSMAVYSYKTHILYQTMVESELPGLVVLMCMFGVGPRIIDYCNGQPLHRPNPFLSFICCETLHFDLALNGVRDMIDKRVNGLTEEQINDLKDITRRVALEAETYLSEYEDK